MTQSNTGISRPVRPLWGAVFALALSAFALVSSEFMPVSLLTPIARGLEVSEGLAGQAISVSGLFALLTSLSISALAGQLDRKILLGSLVLMMIMSVTVTALASNYLIFLTGRALIGIAIGGFWSMSAAMAMRLVPVHKIPRALAVVNGGNALATVVAAPMGSFFGAFIGWRGAFICIVPVALFALIWLLYTMPSVKPTTRSGSRNVLGLMKLTTVRTGMFAVSIFFMGQFALFTYIRPFLEIRTHVADGALSLILLAMGLAGLAGTFLIGAFIKNRLFATLTIIPLGMAAIAVALLLVGGSVVLTTVLLVLWGLLATAAPVGWWTWVARTLPDDAEAGGGLMVAIVQFAIMIGAAVGGVVFDQHGFESTFGLSAVLLLAAAVLSSLTAYFTRALGEGVNPGNAERV